MFGNKLMPGETGGMTNDMWQRIFRVPVGPQVDTNVDTGFTANNPAFDQVMQQPTKPKAFGKGGTGWKILGVIGDALQAAGGGKGTYAESMMDLQKRTDDERKWQAQLAQQAEIARMKAADPGEDSFTRAMMGAGIQPGSPEYIQMARKRAEMLTNPVQLVPDGMGGQVAVRPNSMGGGLPQGYDPSEWEVAPGPGGGVSNGTGGFPRPY
jgi:hypothetical protein